MLSQRSVVVLSALCLAGSAFSQNNILLFEPPDATCAVGIAINDAGTTAGFFCDNRPGLHAYIRDAEGNFTKFDAPGSQDTTPGIVSCVTRAGISFHLIRRTVRSPMRTRSIMPGKSRERATPREVKDTSAMPTGLSLSSPCQAPLV